MAENLIPPDLEQCQEEIPNGNSFMSMGGKYGGRVRCGNKPMFLVQETTQGNGSMTMCPECFLVFVSRGDADKYSTHVI